MKLYVIGNGFDITHGYKTSYKDFEKYIEQHHPEAKEMFDSNYTGNLWSDFENNLVNLKFEEIIKNASDEAMFGNDENILETLPNDIYTYFTPKNLFPLEANELKDYFEEWISSLPVPKKQPMFKFEEDDIFVNFNYTQMLEKTYGISEDRILHIHGTVDENGVRGKELVVGHSEENYNVHPPVVSLDGEYISTDNSLLQYVENKRERAVAEIICDYCNSLNKNVGSHLGELEDFLKGKDIDEIRIYGNSIGKADVDYYKKLNELFPDVKWEYSVYGTNLDQEKTRIKDIVGNIKLSCKQSNQVSYLDEKYKFAIDKKAELSPGLLKHYEQDLLKYKDLGYNKEAAEYLARTACRFVRMENLSILPTMTLDEIKKSVNEQEGIFKFTDLSQSYYTVLDVETTGLSEEDEIVELSIVDSDCCKIYNQQFRPDKEMDPTVEKLTGIKSDDLKDKPSFAMAVDDIYEYIHNTPLVIYNKKFDTKMILQTMALHKDEIKNYEEKRDLFEQKFSESTYCAMQSYSAHNENYKNIKLVNALNIEGIEKSQTHRAYDDCIDTVSLIKQVAQKEFINNINPIEEIMDANGKVLSGSDIYQMAISSESEYYRAALEKTVSDFEKANKQYIEPVLYEDGKYDDIALVTDAYDEYVAMSNMKELDKYKERLNNPSNNTLAQIHYGLQNGLNSKEIDFLIQTANIRPFNNYAVEQLLGLLEQGKTVEQLSTFQDKNGSSIEALKQSVEKENNDTVNQIENQFEFDNQTELVNFFKGNSSYDYIDNTVKKNKENGKLKVAVNKSEEIIGKNKELLKNSSETINDGSNIYNVIDRWKDNTATGKFADFILGSNVDENGIWYYAKVTETDEELKGIFNYEYDHLPSRQEVISNHINKTAEKAINIHESIYGADGEKFFPHLDTREEREIAHGEGISMTEKKAENIKVDKDSNKNEMQKYLAEKLEEGIKATLDSENFANWCKKRSKLYFNNYSFNNIMLVHAQKPDATYVMGYNEWNLYGRQVVKKDTPGFTSIKIKKPVYLEDKDGSLFSKLKNTCAKQLRDNKDLEYGSYRLGTEMTVNMSRNGLFDVKIKDTVRLPHITDDELKKFLKNSVIGKVPLYFNVVSVYDISDTTDKIKTLYIDKSKAKADEIVRDNKGNPITNGNKVQILVTPERQNIFNARLDMSIKASDPAKMNVLYDALVKISNQNKIPVTQASISEDETLKSAFGYYRHPTDDYPLGNIVLRQELEPTNKVATLLHEMAHSDMHRDIAKLKEEMNDVSEITRNMKEIQAEAVAYITGTTFGIETDHSSFNYIAQYSGRDLDSFKKSLNVIYNESNKLLQSIEKELKVKGYDMNLELIDNKLLSSTDKLLVIADNKGFVINNQKSNDIIKRAALKEYKEIGNPNDKQSIIIAEQLVITKDIDKRLKALDEKINSFDKATTRQEQADLEYQMKSDRTQITNLQNKLDDLSNERVALIREIAENAKNDIKSLYKSKPLKAIEELKNNFPEMKDLNANEIKYLGKSNYISREFSQYLGNDNAQFVDLSLKQLNNIKSVLSKNKVAVEITSCENWSDKPIFEEGTVLHPAKANRIIASAEKQIRDFKDKATKSNEYYPYTECNMQIYSVMNNGKLAIVNTTIDIGDGTQKDLKEHISKICKDAAGKEKKEFLDNFIESTKERTKNNGSILLPPSKNVDLDKKYNVNFETSRQGVQSREDWTKQMSSRDSTKSSSNVLKDKDDVKDDAKNEISI